MTQLLQPGHHPDQHPDADQLNAFVEQALPDHERREMLAHLAVCAECREVAALALPVTDLPVMVPPVTDEPAATAKPARPSWLSGWRLAFPAAIAAAALTAIIVYVHSSRTATESARTATRQMAEAGAAAPAPQTPQPHDAQNEIARSNDAPTTGPSAKFGAVTSQAPNAARPPASAFVMSNALQASDAKKIHGPAGALTAPPTQAPAPPPVAAPASPTQLGVSAGVGANPIQSSQPRADQLEANQLQASPANPPKPGPLQSGPVPSAAATVNVQSANKLAMEKAEPQGAPQLIAGQNVSILTLRAAAIHPEWHRLPSKLPILSVVTHDGLVLAIDTNHAVFLSTNGGKHWNAVPAPWQGHAVTADLVTYGSPQPAFAPAAKAAAGAAFGVRGQVTAPAGSVTIAGVVTDRSGAVVPGATVRLTDSIGGVHTVTTDASGRYAFQGAVPGNYQAQIQASGFQVKTIPQIATAPGQSASADATLEVGAASETVEVTTTSQALADSAPPRTARKKQREAAGPPIFSITTDTGEQWTSADGLTWKPK
jgi:hypothetical protein